MAATIDDLDVVDLSDLDNGGEDNQQNGGEGEQTPPSWTSEPDLDNGSDDGDAITDVLKSKGIDDPSKIKIANDDGEIEEVHWNDLSREEQFAILKDDPRETERDEDDLDDEPEETVRPEGNVQDATIEAHELLKKEIAAATAEEEAEVPESYSEVSGESAEPSVSEEEFPEEDIEEEQPVEIKKLAIPRRTASQFANRARKEGDAPDVVRDSITKVTLFDYSDIIGGNAEEEEE